MFGLSKNWPLWQTETLAVDPLIRPKTYVYLEHIRTVVRKRFDFGSIAYSHTQPLGAFTPLQLPELSLEDF